MIVLVMVCAFIPCIAFAQTSGACGENVTWVLDDNGTLTISGTGAMEDYNDYGVMPWYSESANIKKIKIEKGITHVGSFAFAECENLVSVMLFDSVTSIGDSAFYGCYYIDYISYIGSESQWYDIDIQPNNEDFISNEIYYRGGECGENVEWMLDDDGTLTISGTGAMYDYDDPFQTPWYRECEFVQTVTIENGVTTIGVSAFFDCENLTSVTIPNSVISIGENSFLGCNSLESIMIPQSVTSIDEYVLSFCESLKSIDVSPDNSVYSSEDGVLFNKDKTRLICYPRGKAGDEYIVSENVTSMGGNAFYRCANLVSIEVAPNNSMYSSEDGVLFNKDKTELIYFPGGKTGEYSVPNSVTNIRGNAFSYCSGLTGLTIPEGITYIDDDMFSDCVNLQYINIPQSVTSIGEWAFYNCKSLTSIAIPNGVQSIENATFFNCFNLREVTIPESVTSIGMEAFSYCRDLESITIPKSVTSIEEFAFSECISLDNVIIPEGITIIERYVFDGCRGLNTITIPVTVTKIKSYAFGGCHYLENVYYGGSEEQWKALGISYDNEYLMDAKIHYAVVTTESGTCGENLTWTLTGDTLTISGTGEMYDYDDTNTAPWFLKSEKIETVNIENGVTNIGNNAFNNCINLTSVNIPQSVMNIGERAFYYCYNLSHIDLPEGILEIEDFAFEKCSSLLSINIPKSVASIGTGVFDGCGFLRNIDVDKDNSVYSSDNGVLLDINKTKLICCPANKKEYIIPDSVVRIEDRAFAGCSDLTNITIPQSVTSIGDNAFDSCKNLVSITLSDGIENISNNMFLNCSNLESVNIPEGITSIGDNAFSGCGNLIINNIPENVTNIGEGAFADCHGIESISIPEGVTSIKNNTFSNCSCLESISIPKSITSIGEGAFSSCIHLLNVYYMGSEEEWANVNIGSENHELSNSYFHYDSKISMAYQNGQLTISSPIIKTADLMVGYYKGNKFIGCYKEQVDLKIGEAGNVYIDITLPDDADNAKFMLWDKDMEPLCNAESTKQDVV